MSLFKPKNKVQKVYSIANSLAIVALFAQIIQPLASANAETIESLAKVSRKMENASATTISNIPEPKKELEVATVPKPDLTVKGIITAYTSTPDQTDDSPFIAANGKRVHDGMIAVNGLPFGTIIKIPALYGDKEFIVEDRMNRRYSCTKVNGGACRMDIWLDTTRAEALKFGVKRVDVEIYYQKKEVAKK